MPEVSVIVPNYNHADFLHQRIDSILHQTYQDFELIILDDCSTDNSKEVINHYRSNKKISHIVMNEGNSGSVFKQWKKGVDLAKGKLVWIAESDDWADATFLEKLRPAMIDDNTTAMIYCQSYDVNERGEIIESRINWTSNNSENKWNESFKLKGKDFMPFLHDRNVIPNVSACLIKRECILDILSRETGILEFKFCGDWFIWMLIADNERVSIAFINEHLNFFRSLPQSTRNHHSMKLVVKRLLEEAVIFNSGKFSISKTLLDKKNAELKKKWFKVFSNRNFSFSFFELCTVIGESWISLLRDFWKVSKRAT